MLLLLIQMHIETLQTLDAKMAKNGQKLPSTDRKRLQSVISMIRFSVTWREKSESNYSPKFYFVCQKVKFDK